MLALPRRPGDRGRRRRPNDPRDDSPLEPVLPDRGEETDLLDPEADGNGIPEIDLRVEFEVARQEKRGAQMPKCPGIRVRSRRKGGRQVGCGRVENQTLRLADWFVRFRSVFVDGLEPHRAW